MKIFEKLYSNVGEKIMVLALVTEYLIIATSLFFGIKLILDDSSNLIYGVLIILLAPVIGYILTLFTYAFGTLVQSAENIDEKIKDGSYNSSSSVSAINEADIEELPEL